MKKSTILSLVIFSLLCPFLFTSCDKDECENINCQNGAICNSGICDCPPHYEGELCELESREKFLGTYQVLEDCGNCGVYGFETKIEASSFGLDKIILIYDNNKIPAVINGNQFTVDYRLGDVSITGSGTLNAAGNVISFNYTLRVIGSGECSCSATLTAL